jgi:hypothetical protein
MIKKLKKFSHLIHKLNLTLLSSIKNFSKFTEKPQVILAKKKLKSIWVIFTKRANNSMLQFKDYSQTFVKTKTVNFL